ncbi:MAG: hypothetical protein LBN33_01165 [Desulfovibrio sp.]|nr:hypothetical protein [Desulfovibrio sp.]
MDSQSPKSGFAPSAIETAQACANLGYSPPRRDENVSGKNALVRLAAALACLALLMIGAGLGASGIKLWPGMALAANEGAQMPPDLVSPERAALLQSTVDSVALSLGRVFFFSEDIPFDEEGEKQTLRRVLNSLSFELGGGLYFTAWRGTRNICSPLSPDAENMDFAESLDAGGFPFVREMAALAGRGGGFLQARLPLRRPDARSSGLPLDHIIYVREIPAAGSAPDLALTLASSFASTAAAAKAGGGEVFLAAFMPTASVAANGGFSSSWQVDRLDGRSSLARDNLRKGLFLSGFALAGLSGLLLALRRGCAEGQECAG